MNQAIRKFTLIGTCVGLLWACSTGTTDSTEPAPQPGTPAATDRRAMLTNLADNLILPAYASFRTSLDGMRTKADAFTAAPTPATLTAFRQAWAAAYTEWQKVELYDVGPAENHTLRLFFNIYPANTAGIEENIVADSSASLEVASSYARQGFPALDYLINGDTDETILKKFTTAPDAGKRLAYLKRLLTNMNTQFTTVHSEWTGGYRDTFINCTGLDAGCSTSKLVNGFVLHYERYIRSGKVGIPSGAMTNGVPAPEKVEAFYKKDLSLTLARTAHQAAVDFFNGKSVKTGQEGPSLKTYLDGLSAKDSRTGAKLTELINAQFASSAAQLNALKGTLHEEVRTNNTAVTQLYTEMQKAVRMLKVDMTTAMSVTITYTDNDGD